MGWFADLIDAIFGGGGKPKPPVKPPQPVDKEAHLSVWQDGELAPGIIGKLRLDDEPTTWLDGKVVNGRLHFTLPHANQAASYGNGAELYAEAGGVHYQQRVTIAADIDDVTMPGKAPAVTPAARITAVGRRLVVNGAFFPWFSLTAFRLLEYVATGRMDEARIMLAFCREHNVNPRILVYLDEGLFTLEREAGLAALPELLRMARDEYGIYVEVTVFGASERLSRDEIKDTVARAATICNDYGNAILEIANEVWPLHAGQSELLQPQFLVELGELVPVSVPMSLGSTHGPECESRLLADLARKYGNGYATAHDIRTDEENGYKWVRHPNDLAWIADDLGIYMVNDEPQRNDVTPSKHLATGFLCRFIRDIGDTFHYRDGLQAIPPNGVELDAFIGRKQGWTLARADWHGRYRNAGQGWPVRSFTGALRAYSTVGGDEAYTLAIDARNVNIEWEDGAKPTLILDTGDVKIYHVTK